MSLQINSKLPVVSSSIFSVMTALANEHHAINLSQGFPDFPIDKELLKLVNSAMKKDNHQYAPMPGILSLRETIAKKVNKLHQSVYSPDDEITITAGGTQAIFTAIATIIKPNDEAIIFEPAYDCYAPTIKLFGGLVKPFELHPPHFEIDWQMVKKLVTVNTKLMIINSPHNPTGRILKQDDIDELIKITEGTDIAIISDEVYEHIIFDQENHLSLCRYPKLKERTFITASFGKLFHSTGWKVGYCLAPKPLMTEFRKIHQFQVFSVNTFVQHAINEYLNTFESYLNLPALFQSKRDFFAQLLQQTKFKLLDCKGSYFQTVSFAHLSDERDVDFAVRLVKDYKVACIPNSSFYSKNTDFKTLRFCFAKKEETLEKAANFLMKL